MPETLAALLFAHTLADFVFQTRWMVVNKRHIKGLAAHGAVVLFTLIAATGSLAPALVWMTALHMATDALKARVRPGLAAFLADQGVHLAAVAALALWQPGLFSSGLWAGHTALPGLMALGAGAILATRAGGFAIGFLMAPFAATLPDGDKAESLPGAGRVIGLLERGLIFALILLGQPGGVGLLIAAKSILRFGAVKDDRALSEYVIIGTLASFAWALLVGYATLALLGALPPLGILPRTP
ncbi:DUF3307 domain-containing protein [Fuscibacter oryzae]|uniref:DUF3307 domain-containing protein n=1 Tax=Fuscibacter oryzae TaxID=2803939 RepID=A0A8J7SU39_9RHOB|nr:DUF3307 domain-containing protein [Fuscibacter oryzae]MBL4929210.1 DUF3307 domain-containing protein [Fuscibacter oryzae]